MRFIRLKSCCGASSGNAADTTDTADRFTVEPSRVLQDTQPRCEACHAQTDQVSEEKMTSRVADTADRFTVEPSRVLQDTQPRCEACRVPKCDRCHFVYRDRRGHGYLGNQWPGMRYGDIRSY
ncbi:hypothetical protein MTO96_004018 [Rhipicephalus appendiculatus]